MEGCKGTNCAVRSNEHSPECIAEHDAITKPVEVHSREAFEAAMCERFGWKMEHLRQQRAGMRYTTHQGDDASWLTGVYQGWQMFRRAPSNVELVDAYQAVQTDHALAIKQRDAANAALDAVLQWAKAPDCDLLQLLAQHGVHPKRPTLDLAGGADLDAYGVELDCPRRKGETDLIYRLALVQQSNLK